MKLEAMKKFFIHVAQREDSHGTSNAFRFHSVLSSRKEGKIYPARYKYDDKDGEGLEREPLPTKSKKRRKAPAYKGNAELLNTIQTQRPSASGSPLSADATTTPQDTPSSTDRVPRPANAVTGLNTPADTPGPSTNRSTIIRPEASTPDGSPLADRDRNSNSPPPRNRGRKSNRLRPEVDVPEEVLLSDRRINQRANSNSPLPRSRENSTVLGPDVSTPDASSTPRRSSRHLQPDASTPDPSSTPRRSSRHLHPDASTPDPSSTPRRSSRHLHPEASTPDATSSSARRRSPRTPIEATKSPQKTTTKSHRKLRR